MSNVRKGVLLGLAGYAAFSFSDAFIKLLEGGLPVFQVMFIGVHVHIPEVITGLVGAVLIGAAFWSSLRHRRAIA